MRYVKPGYYDKFVCIAGECPATCCAGWQIVIDEESLQKYGNVKGDFGRRLRNSIDWMEESFYQYDKRCAFLNRENLCDLYTELGPKGLCTPAECIRGMWRSLRICGSFPLPSPARRLPG